MTPLEIAQKYVYGEHDALTDNQEIIDMTKDIKEAISEQLILSGVSQQRELLLAYDKFQNSFNRRLNDGLSNKIVDDFLANNCG